MVLVQKCGQCSTTEQRPRHREISAQIWSLLVQWQEVEESAMAQPLCETCYHDIREILIDRSAEMERALATGHVEAPSKRPVAEPAKKTSEKKAGGKTYATRAGSSTRGRKGRIAS